ncbi:type IV toxin-antitoxin system AbiEi family antitoxin domain-containing protein [Actinomarinicola tropica]|uniref:AbiEi antitoxin N-terminal domain-containing protein n=1 Tax=Actinomarinicola tropica TaxID=2789776 RepID=A0A5Q2RMA6_9ACTN|nr:type IV toxin-antitoxin system AbiEi family antitoxin domain-containing protein [Actinomarinicola tropica]QGG96072.1 hypothetical protein GH723_13740 [Actinomarinicola tropica]
MASEQTARLVALAGAQHGVVSVAQARRAGLTDNQLQRLVRAGVVERCDVGILRLVGVTRSWLQDLHVATLRVGRSGAVSVRAAARLFEVEGFDRAPVELSVPAGHRRRPRLGVVHEVQDLEEVDLTRRAGLRVTTPARTLVDVAGVVDETTLEVAIDDLLRRRLTTAERLRDTASRLARQGRTGPRAVLGLLDGRARLDEMTETGFETKLLRVLRVAGLPAPTPQYVLRDADGRFVARFDAAYVEVKVGIEADSERWHMNRRRFVADRTRRAVAESLGWRVLGFTHRHVTAEQRFVGEVVARTLRVARAA